MVCVAFRQNGNWESCSPERRQFRGQYWVFRGGVCLCVLSLCGYLKHTLLLYVWACVFFRASPCGRRERKTERDDNEGPWDGALVDPIVHPPHEVCWRMADGVLQGWGSLLMKSHLRPPFTLNMGHCSCPDLGFDPQRCLTPTILSERPPLPSGARACKCICMRTHPQIHMHSHLHMFLYRYGVGFRSGCVF